MCFHGLFADQAALLPPFEAAAVGLSEHSEDSLISSHGVAPPFRGLLPTDKHTTRTHPVQHNMHAICTKFKCSLQT